MARPPFTFDRNTLGSNGSFLSRFIAGPPFAGAHLKTQAILQRRSKKRQSACRSGAELALRHAEQMLAIMVDIAVNGTSEAVRLAAADKVIDRAMGKAPAHIDITAMRHTDIVYQSAEELRAEFRKALEAEGVPRALLDLTVEDELEEPSAKAHFCPGERRRAGLSVMSPAAPFIRSGFASAGRSGGRPAPARLPP